MRALLTLLMVLTPAHGAWAGADYASTNVDWNGCSSLFQIARRAGLRIEERQVLDLGALRPRTGLLIVGPRSPLPIAELRRFVRAGGRLLVADDVGTGRPFFESLGLNVIDPRPSVVYGGVPHLAVAFPRRRHIILWGIDSIVANHPVALRGTGRVPLLTFESDRALAFAVQEGEGTVLALGDPSILINQMLPFGDNEHLARAALRYLSRGSPARPLWMVRGAFSVRGSLPATLKPGGMPGLANGMRSLAEDAAYGVNAVGWELRDQRPLPGVFMALGVFSGGLALLLLAALWGGGAPLRDLLPRRRPVEGEPPLERVARRERIRLAAALRREVEERLRESPAGEARRERVALEAALQTLPSGEDDPAATSRVSARRLRKALRLAEKVIGPLGSEGRRR